MNEYAAWKLNEAGHPQIIVTARDGSTARREALAIGTDCAELRISKMSERLARQAHAGNGSAECAYIPSEGLINAKEYDEYFMSDSTRYYSW